MELWKLVTRVRSRLAISSRRGTHDVAFGEVARWNEIRQGLGQARSRTLQSAVPESAPAGPRRTPAMKPDARTPRWQAGGQGLPIRFTATSDEGGEVVVSVLGSLGEFAEVMDILPSDGRLVIAAVEKDRE